MYSKNWLQKGVGANLKLQDQNQPIDIMCDCVYVWPKPREFIQNSMLEL